MREVQASNWFDEIVDRDGALNLTTADGDIISITTPVSGRERITSWKMSNYGDYVNKDGNVMEYSYAMPTVKESGKKDGDRFYADVTVNGKKNRMTGNDKAALEAEIRDLKQKERMEHLSRPVRILREANRLFKSGAGVEGYAELCRETGSVARALMGMQLRNSPGVGGQLSTAELNEILADSDKWKDKSAFAYGRETLVRNLEDIAPAREEGRKLVETYWQPIDHDTAAMTRQPFRSPHHFCARNRVRRRRPSNASPICPCASLFSFPVANGTAVPLPPPVLRGFSPCVPPYSVHAGVLTPAALSSRFHFHESVRLSSGASVWD